MESIRKIIKKYKIGIFAGIFITLVPTAIIIFCSFLPDSPIQKEPCFELANKLTEDINCKDQAYIPNLELFTMPFYVSFLIITAPFLLIQYTSFYSPVIVNLVGLIGNITVWGFVGFTVELYLRAFAHFWKSI